MSFTSIGTQGSASKSVRTSCSALAPLSDCAKLNVTISGSATEN